jgi:ribosomal protein S18 acetylase RimI-like enzyme
VITYQTSLERLAEQDLDGFFEGWPDPPTPATLFRLLQRTDRVVLARDADGTVVGFVSALTDGVLCAYITLLEVRPRYQRRGIATELVRRILRSLGEIYMVDAMCDPELIGFYQRLGFTSATGVSIRRYERQAGRDGLD